MQKWERRDKKLEARKNRVPKHGKGLGMIYRNSIEKRNATLNEMRNLQESS